MEKNNINKTLKKIIHLCKKLKNYAQNAELNEHYGWGIEFYSNKIEEEVKKLELIQK